MRIDPTLLRDKEPMEILQILIKEVVKSDEELEEKETRGGRTPDLKIFLADNRGFSIGELTDRVEELTINKQVSAHAEKFFNEHVIKEKVLRENISYVEIVTPDVRRTSEFVFVTNDGYLWVLTTELRDWTRKTIENLLKYLPSVERLYVSSEDLETIAQDIEGGSVSGFTANYYSPNRQRHATLRFHGAEEGDIDRAKEAFGATPSRIEFDQANSPSAAVQGSESNDGIITFESVEAGSESLAVSTAETILGDYQKRDFDNYEVEHPPTRRYFDDKLLIDGYTSIELHNPDREDFEDLVEEIKDEILSSNQYQFGMWDDDTIFIHDKKHREVFELGFEGPNMVLHARESTTALSLRSFCKSVLDEFDSTYELYKTSKGVSAA